MNKRRQGSNLSFPALFVMGLAVAIISVGGITYVMVKNKQITLRNEITKSQQRMVEHGNSITMYQSDISQKLGVFALRESLEYSNSDLQNIPTGLVEIYLPLHEADLTVAQRE